MGKRSRRLSVPASQVKVRAVEAAADRRLRVLADIVDKASVDVWIATDHEHPELKMWPLQAGLYWVVYCGDYEPGDAGSMLYDYPPYRGMFEITKFDEDGTPVGHDYFGGCEWEDIEHIWQQPIFEPDNPK